MQKQKIKKGITKIRRKSKQLGIKDTMFENHKNRESDANLENQKVGT